LSDPSEPIRPPKLQALGLSGQGPLVIVDVDEVLGLFMKGFGEFLAEQGVELRVERYGLFAWPSTTPSSAPAAAGWSPRRARSRRWSG
jgi:hypothetical protein